MKISPRVLTPMVFLALLLLFSSGCKKSPAPSQASQSQSLEPAPGPAGPPPAAAAAPPMAGAGSPRAGIAAPGQAPGAASSQSRPSPVPVGLTVPRGARLDVRLSETIDVKHVVAGQRFEGTVSDPVVVDNTVAIPSGSGAMGEVLAARKRGRFKGRSILELTLTRLNINGTDYRVETSDLTRSKKGKGKRSAALIGGGAGLGMLIGGVATGGVGLLVGGLAGGGAGTLGAAFTGNRDISLPAESVVTFRLANDLTLTPSAQ
ncbi:MAG TPA: hypothetical protein VGR96_04855 [Acidobacteriaceae bacterium]|nr:hypothetical protein [Acidobacteriaceae bacterium]